MGAERGRTWDWLIGLCGLLLIIALFLPWYHSNGETENAWRTLAGFDMILFVFGCVMVSLPLLALRRDTPRGPQQRAVWVVLVAALGLAITIFRMADVPEFDGVAVPVSLRPGAFLAAAACLAALVFALMALRTRRAARAQARTA